MRSLRVILRTPCLELIIASFYPLLTGGVRKLARQLSWILQLSPGTDENIQLTVLRSSTTALPYHLPHLISTLGDNSEEGLNLRCSHTDLDHDMQPMTRRVPSVNDFANFQAFVLSP